jgi:hypothetical protein
VSAPVAVGAAALVGAGGAGLNVAETVPFALALGGFTDTDQYSAPGDFAAVVDGPFFDSSTSQITLCRR